MSRIGIGQHCDSIGCVALQKLSCETVLWQKYEDLYRILINRLNEGGIKENLLIKFSINCAHFPQDIICRFNQK